MPVSYIYQSVNIEKYNGQSFIFEAKIYYKDKLTNYSFAVLTAFSIDNNRKIIKSPMYNDNASDCYKDNGWSSYELIGKIDKNAIFFAVGVAIEGSDSYYLDDFKLFVKSGKDKTRVTLKNANFENDTLKGWQSFGMDRNTKLSLSKDYFFSGKQSFFIDNSNVQVAPTFGNNSELGKYIDVNGVKLYYEIYGEGEPLLLLSGNNTSMGRFSKQIDVLSEKYMVIGLDSRGQGNSTSNNTKITYELMAEDVNTFLNKIQFKNVNILGWSDGGNIAVLLAIYHPDKVKKMAIMGTALYNDDSSVTFETNKLIRKQIKVMEDSGVSKTSMDYRMKVLLLNEPNINPDSLKKIQAPTLVMAGQHDVIKERHTILISEKIPRSKLFIFKGAGHEAPEEIPNIFNETVLTFFNHKN